MRHRLYHGDCLDILPTLADMSVDAIITDIPYGTTACKWDVIIPLDKMWEQVKRLTRGVFVTTASQPFTSVLVCSNLEWFKYEWVYDKVSGRGFLEAKKKPLKRHENVVVFSKNGHTYNPQFTKGKKHRNGAFEYHAVKNNVYSEYKSIGVHYSDMYYPTTWLDNIPKESQPSKDHPTQKPVALYEYLVKTYTNEGDTVLDFAMGSGTTGVSCMNTGRNFIGIEKERDYFEIAEKRINQAQEARQLELVA